MTAEERQRLLLLCEHLLNNAQIEIDRRAVETVAVAILSEIAMRVEVEKSNGMPGHHAFI